MAITLHLVSDCGWAAAESQLILLLGVGSPIDYKGDAMTQDPGSKGSVSQREERWLRGPVSVVEEETTYPADSSVGGAPIPERKIWNRIEYDREGRIVSIRERSSPQPAPGDDAVEWVTRCLYSSAGVLLKESSGREGEPGKETIYHYDDRGRMESVFDSSHPGSPIAFQYDADGRKTRIATARPYPIPPGGTISMSMGAFFERPEKSPHLGEDGSAITVYDAKDRLIEVQLHDSNGAVIRRAVRVYDERGNITEERVTMDDPVHLIPDAQRGKILEEAGASIGALRDELTKLLGAPAVLHSVRNQYDELGRTTLTIRRMPNHEQRVERRYNDRGDVAREIWQSTHTPTDKQQAEWVSSSEVVHSYEYDGEGNWVVKRSAGRQLPDGQPHENALVRRTISYY